ncbi:WD40/YVTN/BNR-like repeat-containing protein [Staphylococcus sp. NAM3COL9]|uniref:WD40/YVTN/BNR-like repeat-containing protein n=1 Tax=Staphylococcus sp. NAM3COL9 TaxID=1667172 RepID=UPI00070F7C21|nr:sialidase family protein [Staphylococcus sp. NAM3COL9]KRG11290.1 hypothetical protein ACA31_01095 [Staphylococcus sp. NAM3COL9]
MKKFFLGLEDELLMVTEKGDDYDSTSCLKGTQPTDLVVDHQNKNQIFCGTYGNGLWKSEDGGESWFAIGQVNNYHEPNKGMGIKSAYITSLAIDDTEGTLYVGTEPSELYYSQDGGLTFTEFKAIQNLPSKPFWQFPPRPYTNHVQSIASSYSNSKGLNVAIEFGAFIYTTDFGQTWNDRPFLSPKDIHTLLAHSLAPGRLYAACGDGFSDSSSAYAESKNDGKAWKYMSEGLEAHPYLYSMAIDPENPDDRFVSASESPMKAHFKGDEKHKRYSTIYRKNGEEPWKEIAKNLPVNESFIYELATDLTESGVVYAFNNHGLFRLKIENYKWERIEIEWKEKYMTQHPSFLVVTSV